MTTFADVRRAALINCSLSPIFGAESVVIGHHGEPKECRVNVQHKVQADPRPANLPQQGTQDEVERIRVVFLRDESWEFGGIATKPNIGEPLTRDVCKDADQRPFTFSGEVEKEDDYAAIYIYERPRRVSQGRRV